MDFSALFPPAPSYFPGLLGEEQARLAQQQAQQQGLLGAALGLMQAGGPSRTPVSFGQSLAQGLQAGQQAYTGALQQRVQEQMIAQQIAEQQRMLKEREAARTILPTLIKDSAAQQSFYGQPSAFPQRDQDGNLMPGAGTIPGKPEVDIGAAMRLLAQAPDVASKVLPTIESFRKMFAPEKVTLKPGEQVFEMRGGQYVPVAGVTKPEYKEVGGALYDVSGKTPKLVIDGGGKYTGEFANIAMGLFGTTDVTKMPPGAFQQIQQEVINQAKARAVQVNLPEERDKKLYGDVVVARVKEFSDAASASRNLAQTSEAINMLLAGKGGGDVVKLGTDLQRFLGIQNETVSAQDLAKALAVRAATTVRAPGSGATSNLEFGAYMQAIPTLSNSAEGRSLMASYSRAKAARDAKLSDYAMKLGRKDEYSEEEMARYDESLGPIMNEDMQRSFVRLTSPSTPGTRPTPGVVDFRGSR